MRQVRPIPQSKECIVIDQLLLGGKEATAFVECPICHKQFNKTRGNVRADGHTVCFLCASRRANSGPNHYLWRGGAALNYQYRCNWDYLAETIRTRDGHRCQYPDCKRTRDKGRSLSVHHIAPFNDSHDNDPRNLITLCQRHHLWADAHRDQSVPMFDNMIMMIYGPDY